jgi:hypothetical protein
MYYKQKHYVSLWNVIHLPRGLWNTTAPAITPPVVATGAGLAELEVLHIGRSLAAALSHLYRNGFAHRYRISLVTYIHGLMSVELIQCIVILSPTISCLQIHQRWKFESPQHQIYVYHALLSLI